MKTRERYIQQHNHTSTLAILRWGLDRMDLLAHSCHNVLSDIQLLISTNSVCLFISSFSICVDLSYGTTNLKLY